MLAPACISLTVPPKCTRVVPFCKKKEDFVGLGRPLGVDFLFYWNACRIGMPRPSPHHAALELRLSQRISGVGLAALIACGARGRGGAGTAEDRKTLLTDERATRWHGSPPVTPDQIKSVLGALVGEITAPGSRAQR